MNREIAFRGFYKGQWVYGSYLHGKVWEDELHQIEHVDANEHRIYNVPKDSVGQFTGLHDKHGKEIYDGDYDQNYDVVAWCEKRSGWALFTYDHPTKEFIECNCYRCAGNFEIDEGEIEIIGNIYEGTDKKYIPDHDPEPDYNAPDKAERQHQQMEAKKLK